MCIHLADEPDPTSQSWQAYETTVGANTSKEIELEEVVKKKRALGRFLPDGTWDDEDPEARARQAKQQTMKIIMVTSFTAAVYMLFHLMMFGIEPPEDNFECENLDSRDSDTR